LQPAAHFVPQHFLSLLFLPQFLLFSHKFLPLFDGCLQGSSEKEMDEISNESRN
jgi:hypothetical protein